MFKFSYKPHYATIDNRLRLRSRECSAAFLMTPLNNKIIMKKVLTSLLILGMVFTGCTKEILPDLPDGSSSTDIEISGEEATIRFNINQNTYTKSSISIDEGQLSNVNIFAYCNGLLYSNVYSTTPNTVSMKLKKGTSYNLYAVANMGAMDAMAKEEDFIRNFAINLNSISDMNGKNPLSWSYEGYKLSSSSGEINMAMDRLYSKVNFTLDKGTLRGLEIKSVKLCQAAKTVRPFSIGGSRALTSHDIMEGDYASASDLEKLNRTGEGVFFYTLENRQGTILPNNTDPWKKIPDNIQVGNLCTYIEVQATFKEGFFYSGNVTYRFYLGEDSTTNFDVFRNNDMNIALILTGDNFGEGKQNISWKVYSDTDLNPNGFSTYEIKHLYNSTRMFVGERFELDATLSSDLFNHIDQNPGNVELCAIDPSSKRRIACISVKSMKKISSGSNGCKLRFIGSVSNQATFSYALFDKRTEKLIADYSSGGTKRFNATQTTLIISQTEACTSVTDTLLGTSQINGPQKTYYVHAFGQDPVTNQQVNLHKTGILSGTTPEETRSLDLEMFKGLQIHYSLRSALYWSGPDNKYNWWTEGPSDNKVHIKYTPIPLNSNRSYVGSFTTYLTNDGTGDQELWQRSLGKVGLGDGGPIPRYHNLGFNIDKYSIPEGMVSEVGYNAFLSIIPAKVTLKYTQVTLGEYALSFVIDNPSKVPFKFRIFMEVPMDYTWFPSNAHKNGKKPICLFYEKEGSGNYQYNRSRFVAFSSFNLKGESDTTGSWISANEWKLNSTFKLIRNLGSGVPPQPNVHISFETYFDNSLEYKTSDGKLYNDFNLSRMREEMLDVNIEGNPMAVAFVNQRTLVGKATRLNLMGRRLENAYSIVEEGRNNFLPGKEPIHFFKPGQDKSHPYGGLLLDGPRPRLAYKLWNVTLTATGYTEYVKFGEGPSLTKEWNLQCSHYLMDWETEFMNSFMNDQYKKEYWHTKIHTKAGHHIVYPRIYRVDMNMKFTARDLKDEQMYYLDLGELPSTYAYQRDHIQRTEKNDNSFYDYTVNIDCRYNGASAGEYYYLYDF